MVWPEIVDRSSVEILLDDRRADVRGTRYGRRISQPLADEPHHRRDAAPRLRRILGQIVLGERDRGDDRTAPGAEVLSGELVSAIGADVLVQLASVEIAELALELVPEDARPRQLQQLAHRVGELLVDDRAPHPDPVLAAILEGDARAADAHMALAQRRDPERPRRLRIAVGADAEPAEIDQPHGDRSDALVRQP